MAARSAPALRGDDVRLSADVGGTFTDIVLECGRLRWSRKVLTTHSAPERGLMRGVAETLSDAGVSPGEVAWFAHGTTLATNALLERRGARTALLTTEGFRDVLEIGYEGRHDPMDLRLVKQRPLVPRELRFTVRERLSAHGDVLIPLDEDALERIVDALRAREIESLAIGFLHAYANPNHERRARNIIQARHQSLSVSLASDVCPEIREYERISTVVANAYVQPLVSTYLDRLADTLQAFGLRCPVVLMTSGGGLVPLDLAKRVPIRLVESGAAGGALLSSALATELGERRILSFDMGGTTAKICFITDSQPQVARLFEVDRSARFQKGSGLPMRIPVVELIEIGAGGGSVVGIDTIGRIVIGPQSAGSEPGPACYARGGDKPTITDADLILGKIRPDHFAGGAIRLDQTLSERAFETHVARRVGLDVVGTAFGTVEVVDETMANAARVYGAELGKDIAQHTIIAFGGAAPLHAARLAEKLGISRVIIPRNAGVGSALGFLVAPLAYDTVISRPLRLDAFDEVVVSDVLHELAERASAIVDGFGAEPGVRVTRQVDMRYVGQGHEVTVPLADTFPSVEALSTGFETRYAELFGRLIPGAPVEVVSWQARVSRETWRPTPMAVSMHARPTLHPIERQPVFDAQAGRLVEYAVYERCQFTAGSSVRGPALIVEDETTTVATSGFVVSLVDGGHLVLDRVCTERAAA
jgi:N-methylhydantoinase A